ncbi:MAG: hypothetical protein H7122_07435 [Chitinophagaceae bacterium]|nr:hypothetical protein [Chitinophagaceae bacterium]
MNNLVRGILLLLFISCNNPDTRPDPSPAIDSTQKVKAYFPVLDFLKSEINYVDSLPVGIMRYTTQNGIIDSGYIKPEEFHRLAQEFLSPVLNRETFENEFSETSFFDNTTQYSSFLYATPNKNLPVYRVDVLVKPEDVVYNKVKSIYMEKLSEKGDSSIVQKLYWKAGHHFQISSEIRTSKPEITSSQVKVVWNPWD